MIQLKSDLGKYKLMHIGIIPNINFNKQILQMFLHLALLHI